MLAPRGAALIAVAVTSALATGCGRGELPRAAEPADAPKPQQKPAGALLAVGSQPEGLVADPVTGLLAVALRDPDRLALLDIASGRIVRRVPLPAAARHLSLARPGGPVLVPAERANQLVRVYLPGGGKTAIAVGAHPHDAASASGRVFVADEFGDEISVVRGDRVTARLAAPVQPGGIARAGRFIALIAVRERVLATYDAVTGDSLGELDAGAGPTHIAACGDDAFVADTQGDAILEFRIGRSTKRVGRTPSPGAPYGIAANCARHNLWVTSTGRNSVVVYRMIRPGLRSLARYPTVRQPNSVAVDPRSGDAYVGGGLGRVVEKIVPAGFRR